MGGFKLYFQLLGAVLLSGLAALAPLAWMAGDALRSSYREYAVRDVTANAHLLALAAAPHLAGDDAGSLAVLLRAAQADSLTRFTIIARDGSVIADSEEEAARMENHANRLEIREALSGGTGVDIRKSPTLGTDWIYAAIPAPNGLVIRAAASLDEVDTRLAEWWKRAAAGFALSLALLACLALLLSRALARPLEVAAAGADQYAKGDLTHRIPVSGSAEMRRLAVSLNGMAEELDARFRLILRQGEEMRAVFENMGEGVLAVDADGGIMLANDAAENILGLSGDFTGKRVESLVRIPDLLTLIREAATADTVREAEVRIAEPGAGEKLVHANATRIREQGDDMGVLTVLRDVTHIRRLEAIRRDFVANVSHELRTPVTTIQSCLESLIEDGVDDKDTARDFLEMALRNTRRLGSIIGNLLFLAGMESEKGGKPEKAARHPVRPVVDEALSLCRDSADARNISFTVECDNDTTALMNPPLVVHALVNLLDNAIKYGPEGGAISISAQADDETVRITVADEGPGIDPRFQSRVFERFYRVNGSSRIKEGSGLGLSLVKHIAMAQGGKISLESTIGAGSAFILSLPRTE